MADVADSSDHKPARPRRDPTPVEVSPQEVVSKSVGGAATTTLVGLVGRAAGLLTTILVTHFVSKTDYGHANLAMIIAAVLNILTLLSPQQVLLTMHKSY